MLFRSSHFVTRLPAGAMYSPSHFWLVPEEGGVWRVGFTKFAVRMLGELVDQGFETKPGEAVRPGTILGWIEGFKAISDLYAIAAGRFAGGNPLLKEKIAVVNKDPFGEGWIYLVEGQPDARCMDVHGYRAVLDKAIDKILEKQKADEKA